MHHTELNIFGFKASLFMLVALMVALAACTTSDVAPTADVDPTVNTLAELKVVEEFKVDDELSVKRHQADPFGRFTVAISPLDGSDRERAFGIAETAFVRFCNSSGAGVGRTGRRAPLYSSEKSTYFVYMQCGGTPSAPTSGG